MILIDSSRVEFAIPGNYQLFTNPEARSKVIDAATMLGRTTGSLFRALLLIHLPPPLVYFFFLLLFSSEYIAPKSLHLWFLFVSDRFESYFWFWTYISHLIVTHLFAGLVLVDCSATYDTVNLMKDAVGHGCCIVLANKKPLTGAYVMLFDLLFSANSLSWWWMNSHYFL